MRKKWLAAIGCLFLLIATLLSFFLSSIGAVMILRPLRKNGNYSVPAGIEEVAFQGSNVTLHGWRAKAIGKQRGTLVYLHGVSDHLVSASGVIARFQKWGFDVVTYDSRAHGKSGGNFCTYGFYEKEDLRKVIDQINTELPVIVMGTSLGAAVGLQAAAIDARISGVIAAECFSDLRTVVTERAPFVFSPRAIERAISIAEQKGAFSIDAVSPVLAAEKITVPVLLIHGEADAETAPAHSQRLFQALPNDKKLLLVPGANHNQSLNGFVWSEIELWLKRSLED